MRTESARAVVGAFLALVTAGSVHRASAAEPPAPLAWYDFSEGAGTDIHDRTGHGYDGKLVGATFVPNGRGGALQFEQPGAYAECAPGVSFGLKDQVSLEAWVCPEAVPLAGEPGIVGQAYESFVLTYYTDGRCWWYIGAGGNHCAAPLGVGEWHHVVGTFDGKALRLYVDGALAASNPSQTPVIPDGKGLLIARQTGDPKYAQGKTFTGRVADVRLYGCVLSAEDVAARYRTSNLTGAADVAVFPVYFDQQLGVTLSLRGLGERPPDASASLELVRTDDKATVQVQRVLLPDHAATAEATLRVGDLAPGPYELRCTPLNAQGTPIGVPATRAFTWPNRPAWPNLPNGTRILNNLVTELLNVQPPEGGRSTHPFINPREGWVFVATGPGAEVSVDGTLVTAPEAMRWLSAGAHALGVSVPAGTRLERILVRAIPTLGYSQFQANPHITPFGPYDWAFLQKHVLPHCNLVMAGGDPSYKPYLEEWKKRGGKWIVHASVPGLDGKPVTADEVEKVWRGNLGMTEPLVDGIIVDEFFAGDEARYAPWTEALRRIAADPGLKGKLFIPYGGGAMYAAKGSAAFIRTAFDMGSPFANERYLPEQPTESGARRYLDTTLRADADGWNKGTPEGVQRMLMTLGYLAAPNESLDIDPGVDWRVYMDMQMQLLATDPAFFGLWGVKWYLSSYADEEQVRLGARLFRHYAIEGKTGRFLSDPYILAHLRNPDFADGLAPWTITAAEPGSVTTGSMPGFSWLQGRYPQTSRGDAFLVLRRSAAKPNVVTQKIAALQPGRLYALRMFAADWKDLGKKQELAVAVTLDGVDTVPEKSFVFVINSCYSHTVGEFNAQHPAWFNYIFRVFRATGTEAGITISDWAKPGEPGGPAGQETAVNFVQIQPYWTEW